jgi:hypothetical protein
VFVELHLDDLVEAAIDGNSLIVRAGDLLDKIDDGSTQLCVRNLHEGFRQRATASHSDSTQYAALLP